MEIINELTWIWKNQALATFMIDNYLSSNLSDLLSFLIKQLLDGGHKVFILTTHSRKQIRNHFDFLKDAPAPDLIPFKNATFSSATKFWKIKGACGICNHKAGFDVLIDDCAINYVPTKGTTKEKMLKFKPVVYPR